MKKIIMGIIAIVVLAVAAAFTYVYVNSDKLVKEAIEKYGSQVAGVKVSVGSVKLDIPGGKVTISGLSVANPSGYNTPTAFKLGEIGVALDTAKSTKSLIVINKVLVGAPEVTYEMGGAAGSNLQAIQQNVKAFSAKMGGGGNAAEAPKPADDKNAVKLIIDSLDITNGKVNLATPIPGIASSANLDNIHLSNIGRSSNGASSDQVASQVLNAVTNSAMKSVDSLGIGDAANAVQDTVKAISKDPAKALGSDPAKALGNILGK